MSDHDHATTGGIERVVDESERTIEERAVTVPADRFDELRARFAAIEGTVQLLVTGESGAVVLETFDGADGWHPPGGEIQPGESVAAAAVRAFAGVTDIEVTVDRPINVSRTTFECADSGETTQTASVTVAASPVDGSVPDDPLATDPTHDIHPDPAAVGLQLDRFETVPSDVNPNHEQQIREVL